MNFWQQGRFAGNASGSGGQTGNNDCTGMPALVRARLEFFPIELNDR
jgi:hypothetical protein